MKLLIGHVCCGLPISKGHALEELSEGRVYGEVRRARLAEVIRLTGLFVDSVKVVAFLRGVLAVGPRHHEVSAVDDLGFQPFYFQKPQVGVLRVRVVLLLLLYAGCRAAVSLSQRHLPSSSNVGNSSRQIASIS